MPRAQQLGRYQLLDRIAFGGMAEIFRAKTFDAEGRGHLVAVKRVLNHLTHDEDFLRMLVDEAKLTALLQHENIAQVYELTHEDDEYFIAMEYVDGKDVRALLERFRHKKQPLPPEIVAWIVMETAHGLHAAHGKRDSHGRALHIVHRDVSPSNMLCSYNGEVKLCDFGIAKATLTRVQTKTGVIKGKVKYMSPEQAMGRRLDHRSDLFSLGTVMYEMLTLEAPFVAPSEVELIFAVRDANKRNPRELVPIPEELAQILDKLMSRSRSQRYQSGEELALALRLFLDRYRPGFRRSHFGRFMRHEFADDIERELRLLEEYVIEAADPARVGENLIADALPANAPYTKFTAAVGEPAQGTGPEDAPPGDLHALETRILAAPRSPEPARAVPDEAPAAHDEVFDERPPLHELETRILAENPLLQRLDLDDEAHVPTEAHGQHGHPGEPTPLAYLPTRILAAPVAPPPEPLHDLETRILPRSALSGPPADPLAPTEAVSKRTPPRTPAMLDEPRRLPVAIDPDKTPADADLASVSLRGFDEDHVPSDEEETAGVPKVVLSPETKGDYSEDEQTSVPLADDDLEPA